MPGLDELKVSLTKNGFNKIADVLFQVGSAVLLENLDGTVDGAHINDAQTKKMLSYDETQQAFPPVWEQARSLGQQPLRALSFIAILFSHRTYINAFTAGSVGEMRGLLTRSSVGDKAYTNIVALMRDLGLTPVGIGSQQCDYNLAPLFEDRRAGPLAKQVLELKLEETGWTPPGNDDFRRDFYEQCFHFGFDKVLSLSPKQFTDWMDGNFVEHTEPPFAHIAASNIEVSASLLLSLAAKQFIILTGTAGTGKTRTIRDLVSKICPSGLAPTFNNAFVPVASGWTDGRHLTGYRTPFGANGDQYVSTGIIELLSRANDPLYSKVPFFIILDEMNLSHVEIYFSKFLSVMEARGTTHDEPLLSGEDLRLLYRTAAPSPIFATHVEKAINAGGLFFTKNVFVVGTVNVDDTTHTFSPKVLDRAFVIEYRPQTPSTTSSDFALAPDDTAQGQADKVASILLSENLSAVQSSRQGNLNTFLDEVFTALGRFRFGPRVTIECRKYLDVVEASASLISLPANFADFDNIKDNVMLQKILPKLHGNGGQIGQILAALKVIATAQNLHKSHLKLSSMELELQNPGFTNYFAA